MKNIFEAYLEVNAKASRFSRAVGFYSLASVREAMGCSREQFVAALEAAIEEGGVRGPPAAARRAEPGGEVPDPAGTGQPASLRVHRR